MNSDQTTTGSLLATASPDGVDVVEVRLLLICQSEGLRNRYAHLAGYEESDDNSGLTALGWEQTNLLAAWLKAHQKIDVLISAPQLRSRLTAQRIGQVLGMPVKVRVDLPRHSANMRTPGSGAEMSRLLSALFDSTLPSEDPEYRQFCDAVVSVVDSVLVEHWGKTIAVVMSGAAVAAITRQFLGKQFLPIAVSHSGITEFNRRNGQWRLAYANRREHLPMPNLAQTPPLAGGGAGGANYDPEELDNIIQVYNRVGLRRHDEQVETDRKQRMRDLLRFAHLAADGRVLDLGTGGGQMALLLAEEGAREAVGIDVSPVMLEAAEYLRLSYPTPGASRVSFRLAPAQALPFGDESFDVVICRLVLQHTRKPERILQEAARVLRIGGVLILAGSLAADDPVKRATQNAIEERRNPAHVAARTADTYRKLVVGSGLVIEAEKVSVFERELDEWLNDMQTEPTNRAIVRDMIEAGMETDASGLHVRKQGGRLLFEQRLLNIRAAKKP